MTTIETRRIVSSDGAPPLEMRAVFSEFPVGATYRYALERRWDHMRPYLVMVMLNPSTADAVRDDPTIRRCVGFAKKARAGGLLVLNLFAYRATDPRELREAADPVGPENDEIIKRHLDGMSLYEGTKVVAAWGRWGARMGRDKAVLKIIQDAGFWPYCLGMTANGQPRHPLFVPAATKMTAFLGGAE